MKYFLKDSAIGIKITWDQLLDEITDAVYYNPYCFTKNYYEVFKHIIISLIYGKEIILLDSDFTKEELIKLTGYSEFSNFDSILEVINKPDFNNKIGLIHQLQTQNSNWSISLFTSGTTGLPKKVSHNFESITRFVKKSDKNANDIWGFAYNPTHMAGIQVFLQALLNGNPIIRLFGLSPELIYKEIKCSGITHISATPSFYRLLLPHNDIYPTVKRITSGGEKFDEKTFNQLTHIFPNASIKNVYASTEAGSLFASDGNTFSIKQNIKDLIKIDDNELLIHKSLMGTTNININEWYRTGDLIEILSKNPLRFRFLSRKNEMINVGGYKVDPNEVEDSIRSLQGIKDVRVFAKNNSVLGKIICCEIVRIDKHLEETNIRAYLQMKLQEYKIPRMMRFIEEIQTTRTGKIKRS
jgi:acyl-coenzyme A synthetase/AMP-(fatty) acid ligase